MLNGVIIILLRVVLPSRRVDSSFSVIIILSQQMSQHVYRSKAKLIFILQAGVWYKFTRRAC